MDKEKMAKCRMMLLVLFHKRIHLWPAWKKPFFRSILKREKGAMESMVYYLKERSDSENAEYIMDVMMDSGKCKDKAWRPVFQILVETILQIEKNKSWVAYKLLELYQRRTPPCPMIPEALPYINVHVKTGFDNPRSPCIDKTLLYDYVVEKDIASFTLLINALPQTDPKTYALYKDAFQVCCSLNWYEGAKHCYEQDLVHRLFFNDCLIYDLLRYPTQKEGELDGFFVDHPSIFTSFLEDKKICSRVRQASIYHCLRTNNLDALKQCDEADVPFSNYAYDPGIPLSVDMIRYCVDIPVFQRYIKEILSYNPFLLYQTVCSHGDAGLLQQIVSMTCVKNHGISRYDLWKVMMACPPRRTECYPILLSLAFPTDKSNCVKPALADLLLREVPFITFVFNFMEKERTTLERNTWLIKHLCQEEQSTFLEVRWEVLSFLKTTLGTEVMEEIALQFMFTVGQLQLLFPPTVQEGMYENMLLKYKKKEGVLNWIMLDQTLEELMVLPQALVLYFIHNLTEDDLYDFFQTFFDAAILDIRVLPWFLHFFSEEQQQWLRRKKDVFLSSLNMDNNRLHWNALYHWAQQQWGLTSIEMRDYMFDIDMVRSLVASSIEVMDVSLFQHAFYWSLFIYVFPMKTYRAFYQEWFHLYCKEGGNRVISYFYVVYYLCQSHLSTTELQHFHSLAQSTMLTEPHYYPANTPYTLLHVACSHSHMFCSTARALLLTIPSVRQEGMAHRFYASDHARQIANDIDTSRESAMHAFSPQEQVMFQRVEDRYGAIVRTRGVGVVIDEFFHAMKIAYKKEVGRDGLPFAYDELMALPLNEVEQMHAKASYHSNVWHTAARFGMKPNPWMHPHASWVCVDPHHPQHRWASFESDKTRYVFSLYWLAATDAYAPCVDGFTLDSRIEFFARTIALLNRAHNYDQITRRRKLPHGKEVEEEVDDGEGDRPSCSMGMERRLLTSVPGNPLTHYVDHEEKMKEAVQDTLRQKIRTLSSAEQQTLIHTVEKYLMEGGLNQEEIFVMQSVNLTEEEQEACLLQAQLSASPSLITNNDTLHCQVLQYIPSFYVEMNLNGS